jgi:hypothetical protein
VLVTNLLLIAVTFYRLRVPFPVLLLILRMSVTPLLPTLLHDLGIQRIGTDLGVMIIAAAAPLARGLAANDLMRMIADRLENLLTVTATTIIHQAAPKQNAIASFCSEPPGNLQHRQKIIGYRNSYRVSTASPPMGPLLIKPAEMMLFLTGADTLRKTRR